MPGSRAWALAGSRAGSPRGAWGKAPHCDGDGGQDKSERLIPPASIGESHPEGRSVKAERIRPCAADKSASEMPSSAVAKYDGKSSGAGSPCGIISMAQASNAIVLSLPDKPETLPRKVIIVRRSSARNNPSRAVWPRPTNAATAASVDAMSLVNKPSAF